MNDASDYRVRFVERPLSERSLTPQIEAIIDDQSLRVLTISDTGIEMLTAIVGRGMAPSLRRVVAESLRETMHGRIPLGDEATDSILTEVYGETIGPLVTCLERGGNFDIIRLERSDGADLLLVDKQSLEVILQECKGTFADYAKVRTNNPDLDVCQQMRNQRNKGKQQLHWPDASEIGSRRVRVRSSGVKSVCPVSHAEETVVVTAIPDGRLRRCAGQVSPAAHDPCERSCVEHCLFSPEPALICVLSSQRDDQPPPLDETTRTFLESYKTCERAIWGNAHGSVGDAFAEVLRSAREMELRIDSEEGESSFLTALLERAIERDVYIDFSPIFQAAEAIQRPAFSRTIGHLHDLQGEVPRPRITDVELEEFASMFYSEEGESDSERLTGNWRFRISGPLSEGEGTPAETSVQRTPQGGLEMRLVPRRMALEYSSDDLRWGISSVLSGGRFPTEYVYDLFVQESAALSPAESQGEARRIVLGQTLQCSPYWPIWPAVVSRRMLREMHRCCPICDRMADLIEMQDDRSRISWLPYHRWYRRHHRWLPFGGTIGHPLAFVTNDARGFMSLPLPVS